MFRVLIVDDEPLILAGVISLIDWEEYHCKIVGKATNGKQALELIEEVNPDIIITDIKMPVMNGIELMEKTLEADYNSKFIILTNLEEFGLVKQAISLGAIDYLVKIELTETNFSKTLEKAIEACIRDGQCDENYLPVHNYGISQVEATKLFFQKLLILEDSSDKLEKEAAKYRIKERYEKFIIIMIHLNHNGKAYPASFSQQEFKKMMSYAESVLIEMIKRFFPESCLLNWDINKFLLIISINTMNHLDDTIKNMNEKMQSVLKDYFEMSVIFAIGQPVNGVDEIQEGLYQATTAMNHYYYDSDNPIIYYSEEYEMNQKHSNNFNISFLKKDISKSIQENDSAAFRKIIEQIVELYQETKLNKRQATNGCINLYYFIASVYEYEDYADESKFPYVGDIMGQLNNMGSLKEIIYWLSFFAENICKMLDIRRDSIGNTKADAMVKMVKKYIKNNAGDKLTLGLVAEKMGISQGYLSSIFKKQTGRNFSDYVSEVKIEKSKEYIATHQYMIYEVSDILGFDNAYYFSKVFKKVTGMTPREYEKSLINF